MNTDELLKKILELDSKEVKAALLKGAKDHNEGRRFEAIVSAFMESAKDLGLPTNKMMILLTDESGAMEKTLMATRGIDPANEEDLVDYLSLIAVTLKHEQK